MTCPQLHLSSVKSGARRDRVNKRCVTEMSVELSSAPSVCHLVLMGFQAEIRGPGPAVRRSNSPAWSQFSYHGVVRTSKLSEYATLSDLDDGSVV